MSESSLTPSFSDRKSPPTGRPAGGAAHDRVEALIDTLDGAARDLRSSGGVDDTLTLIVDGAVASVPAADQAGVTLVDRRGNVTTRAPSSPLVAELDALQAERREGPCLDAALEGGQVTVTDLSSPRQRERWRHFAPAANARGIGAVMAVELFAEPGATAALNMYAAAPGAFDRDSREVGALFASHAAIALFGARRAENLDARAMSRDLIGQAKGIVMHRHRVDDDTAFRMLVRTSNDRRTKLLDLARLVIEAASSGRTPPL